MAQDSPAPVTPKPVAPIVSKPVEHVWKVGDYYNVDGKEGVVFWVDETRKHGKIVSLDQAEKMWCTDDEYRKGLTGIASDEYDGMKNLQSIQKISDWRNKYPAFAWCTKYGKDWYLPSIDELEKLMCNSDVLTAVFLNKRKRSINRYVRYWSSTEYSKWSAKTNGFAPRRDKHMFVRAVSAF